LMIALDDDVERGPLASRKRASIAVISLTSCDNQHAFCRRGDLILLGSLYERIGISGLTQNLRAKQNFVMRRSESCKTVSNYLGLMKRT
jgi:hypothetical protein